MNKFFWYAFIIALVTLALVYYKGLVSDVNAVGPFGISLAQIFQGRNPQTGNFSPYPSGA